MWTPLTSLSLALLVSASPAPAEPLAGTWTLDLSRSHYGGGAEPRKSETFTCVSEGDAVKCTIDSVRSDGHKLTGTFTASYDGKPGAATGIPDVDQVTLRKIDDSVVDATFSRNGKPVFGYRAIRSDTGKTLTFVSVDPTTRAIGHSLIVYERK